MVFPYGTDVTMSSTPELYTYAQQYKLYPVVKLSDNKYYPAISDANGEQLNYNGGTDFSDADSATMSKSSEYTWDTPYNTINGYNLIAVVQGFNSTAFKYQLKEGWLFSMGIILLILGALLVIGALIRDHFSKRQVQGDITPENVSQMKNDDFQNLLLKQPTSQSGNDTMWDTQKASSPKKSS